MDSKQLQALNAMGVPQGLGESPSWLRLMVYGDFGIGKTHLAYAILEAIQAKKVLHVTTDSAWVTGFKFPDVANRTDRVEFRGYSQLKAICQAHIEGIEPWAAYDSLVWDTVTSSHETVIDNTVDVKKFKDQIDPDSASWTHYNITKTGLRRTLEAVKQCQMNVIYLGHLREPSQAEIDKGKRQFRPNMPEKAFKLVAQEVQLLGWLHRNREKQRVLHVQSTDQVAAKTTLSTIPETQAEYPADLIPQLIKNWRAER